MDFWCRGRVDIAQVTAEPAEEVLLADISVRLLVSGGGNQKKYLEIFRCPGQVFSYKTFKQRFFQQNVFIHKLEIP